MTENQAIYGNFRQNPEQKRQKLLQDPFIDAWIKQILVEQWQQEPKQILRGLELLQALWLEKMSGS